MDTSLWQTFSSFEILYSSHEWLPIVLSCGWYSSTLQKWLGLRMDSIPVLDLWNVVIEVLHSSNNVPPIQNISAPKNNRDHNSTRRPQRKQQRVKLGAGGGKSAKFWTPSPSSHSPLRHPHTLSPNNKFHRRTNQKGPRETAGAILKTPGWRRKVTETLISCQI